MLDAAQTEVTSILTQRTRSADGFQVINQSSIREVATASTDVFTTLLGAVAAISMLVGGIGVMNIMLVSVTERTREIGIRKAIGARRADILAQFLTEAVVISAFGGVTGVLVGDRRQPVPDRGRAARDRGLLGRAGVRRLGALRPVLRHLPRGARGPDAPDRSAALRVRRPMTDEDLLSTPLPTRPRGRLLTGAGAVFGAVAIGALGFLGGVHVQKAQGDAATPARMALPRRGGAASAAAQRAGQQQTDGTTGEVSSVDGSTFYVEDASGNTVRVRAGSKAKVSRNAVADAGRDPPGRHGRRHGPHGETAERWSRRRSSRRRATRVDERTLRWKKKSKAASAGS